MNISVLYAYFLSQERSSKVHNRARAKSLLRTGYQCFFGTNVVLPKIWRTNGQKPRMKTGPQVDFNTTYTDGTVVCAISTGYAVGIDAEIFRALNVFALQDRFSANEWRIIESSNSPSRQAIDFWVRKEAVLKACGLGLSAALETVDTSELSVAVAGKAYRLQRIGLNADVCCWLAYRPMEGSKHNGKDVEISIKALPLDNEGLI